jgi:hypothetical protein
MIERLTRLLPHRRTDPRDCTMVIGLGAMKSGTTWLSDYLGSLPGFLHSPVKEMNVFNLFAANPFCRRDEGYRLLRMEEIILSPRAFRHGRNRDRLRAYAQIGRIHDTERYLEYFAERMRGQTHFGEISPSYSHLPIETLQQISELTRDVRFLFVLRDPARRAASHIRHLRRRIRADASIDTLLTEVEPGHPVWMRSDYGFTIDQLAAAGLAERSRVMTYETLFQDDTMRGLCDWLEVPFIPPRPDKTLNAGRGDDLTADQLVQLRDRLEPIYADLSVRDLPAGSERWQWR